MNISLQKQIELRFRGGANCPHCGSRSVVKFGFFNNNQRYRCKECRKTFNAYTKTLLSWSHYKDKWEDFIGTMQKDMSLREAEKEIHVDYVTLFYWRHKIMYILNQESDALLHGTIEMMNMKLPYLNKNYNKRNNPGNLEDEKAELQKNISFTFIYQRSDRLKSYVYKDNAGLRTFISDLAYEVDNKSLICLNSNIPFRLPLLYNKFKVANNSAKKYKRRFYYNAKTVRNYLTWFKNWLTIYHGVSSKNLIKYSAYFKTNKIFNNMENIIIDTLRESWNIGNMAAARGTPGY